MPTVNVPFKRGTTAQNAAYTGEAGEITVDTSLRTLRVHDGAKQGGEPLLRAVDAPTSNVVDAPIVGSTPNTSQIPLVVSGVLNKITLTEVK